LDFEYLMENLVGLAADGKSKNGKYGLVQELVTLKYIDSKAFLADIPIAIQKVLMNPQVFLLDEPLSNLDAKLRVHMRAELATLHQQVRTTMIYVTHDQLEAMTLSDQIVVMNHGQVQQIGSPEEVYKLPKNRFVAEFMGTPAMNLIEGSLSARSGNILFEAAGLRLGLPDALQSQIKNSRILLGFRPEDLAIAPEAASETITGKVSVAELAGAEKFLYVDLGGAQVVTRVPADQSVHAGDVLHFRLPGDRIHVFDGVGDDAPAVRPS